MKNAILDTTIPAYKKCHMFFSDIKITPKSPIKRMIIEANIENFRYRWISYNTVNKKKLGSYRI